MVRKGRTFSVAHALDLYAYCPDTGNPNGKAAGFPKSPSNGDVHDNASDLLRAVASTAQTDTHPCRTKRIFLRLCGNSADGREEPGAKRRSTEGSISQT